MLFSTYSHIGSMIDRPLCIRIIVALHSMMQLLSIKLTIEIDLVISLYTDRPRKENGEEENMWRSTRFNICYYDYTGVRNSSFDASITIVELSSTIKRKICSPESLKREMMYILIDDNRQVSS
jgi:hypothetical protein